MFATTMMGVPLFFFETQLLSEQRRAEVKPLITTYKQHRDALHAGTVYPLGSEPDDHSWTGFQSVATDSHSGYLTLFREIDNGEPSREIALHFLGAAKSLRLTNLMNNETTTVPDAPGGCVHFSFSETADYRFLRYERQ
ncbi:MAG: hypothetical protein ACP5I4_08000 [Oceanipulchritudo sp.]|jgi:hypothetical protein